MIGYPSMPTGIIHCPTGFHTFLSPEPTILLACGRNREFWEQPFQARVIDADCMKSDGQNSVILFCYFKMVALRALTFRPLVKGKEDSENMAKYWLHSFLACLWTLTPSWSIYIHKERTWPISSHLDPALDY